MQQGASVQRVGRFAFCWSCADYTLTDEQKITQCENCNAVLGECKDCVVRSSEESIMDLTRSVCRKNYCYNCSCEMYPFLIHQCTNSCGKFINKKTRMKSCLHVDCDLHCKNTFRTRCTMLTGERKCQKHQGQRVWQMLERADGSVIRKCLQITDGKWTSLCEDYF